MDPRDLEILSQPTEAIVGAGPHVVASLLEQGSTLVRWARAPGIALTPRPVRLQVLVAPAPLSPSPPHVVSPLWNLPEQMPQSWPAQPRCLLSMRLLLDPRWLRHTGLLLLLPHQHAPPQGLCTCYCPLLDHSLQTVWLTSPLPFVSASAPFSQPLFLTPLLRAIHHPHVPPSPFY